MPCNIEVGWSWNGDPERIQDFISWAETTIPVEFQVEENLLAPK